VHCNKLTVFVVAAFSARKEFMGRVRVRVAARAVVALQCCDMIYGATR
jgi:hypothetical protein